MRVLLHELERESLAAPPAHFIPLSPTGGEGWGEGADPAAGFGAAPLTLPSPPAGGRGSFWGAQ